MQGMFSYLRGIYRLVIQKDDCGMETNPNRKANFRTLMHARCGSERGAQSRFAERLERSANLIARYLSGPEKDGSKEIGEKFARYVEERMDVERYALDQDPVVFKKMLLEGALGMAAEAEAGSDYELIPQYTAKGASGPGFTNDHVEIKGGLAFRREWLARLGLKPHNLRVIHNHGDSNWPTLACGDVLLIDVSLRSAVNGKLFAMYDADSAVMVKRLVREMSGDWIIRSDNQNKTLFPDLDVSAKAMESVEIIGRVVWRGGEV